MKKLLNIIMYFIVMAFTLILSVVSEPSSVYAHTIIPSDYICAEQREPVVLIASNVHKETMSFRQQENNYGFADVTSPYISYNESNGLFSITNIHFRKYLLNNLANNTQKTQQIRAP